MITWHSLGGKKYRLALVFFLVVVGAVLRIYGIGSESLWYDEVGSLDQATRGVSSLFRGFFHDPVLFPLLLKCWIALWGVSETALRSLSCLFGIGTLFLNYKAGRLLFNDRVALLSTFLLALSPFHIFYSQDARYYSLGLLLVLWSVVTFLELLGTGEKKYYVYLSFVNSALLLSNPLAVFIVLIENAIYFLSAGKKRMLLWFAAQIIPAVVLLVLGVFVTAQYKNDPAFFIERIAGIPGPSWQMLVDTLSTFNYGGIRYGGTDIFVDYSVRPAAWYNLLLNGISVVVLCLYAGFLFKTRRRVPVNHVFVISWLCIPLVVLLSWRVIYVPRYILFCLPAYLFMLAFGIDHMRDRYTKWTIVSAFVMLLVVVALPAYYTQDKKIDWRGAMSSLNAAMKNGDILCVTPSKQVQMIGYYGAGGGTTFPGRIEAPDGLIRQNASMVKGGFLVFENDVGIGGFNTLDQLDQIIIDPLTRQPRQNDVWVIITRWVEEANAEVIKRYLETYYTVYDAEPLTGIEIYRCVLSDENKNAGQERT